MGWLPVFYMQKGKCRFWDIADDIMTLPAEQIENITQRVRKRRIIMGYFSDFMCDYEARHQDHSITEPKQQLLWRLEELQERLAVLEEQGAPYCGSLNYAADDYRHGLSEEFLTIFDTERAIDATLQALKYDYGVDLYPKTDVPVQDEITHNQISIWMLLPGAPLQTAA